MLHEVTKCNTSGRGPNTHDVQHDLTIIFLNKVYLRAGNINSFLLGSLPPFHKARHR